jgi:hypothetical protein
VTEATPMDDHDLRVFARAALNEHDPTQQPGNPYERCALCHYTRHPCDVYDLAHYVLQLLDRLDKTQLAYIEATNPGIDMDQVRRHRGTTDDQV